ncbi:phosphatase PAP2 family protein [Legionella sp. W05-934-2]|uniref:phosphatase PAP2 family protein n=1 Tax=Legionella sp. W05-934-2 TaxID=1198649 RepID=UPI003461A978
MFSIISRFCHWIYWISFLAVLVGCYLFVDRWVAQIVYQHPSWHQFHFLYAITLLGTWSVMVALVIVLYLFSRVLKLSTSIRETLAQIGLTLIATNSIATILKTLCGRARPMLWFDQHMYGFYGPTWNADFWSFPSGHTVTIMSIMWSLCFIYSKYCVIWLGVGIIVVATRIVLLQHYLSDVLASAYLSLVVAVFIYRYRQKWNSWV